VLVVLLLLIQLVIMGLRGVMGGRLEEVVLLVVAAAGRVKEGLFDHFI
jgi:hypothetical protein